MKTLNFRINNNTGLYFEEKDNDITILKKSGKLFSTDNMIISDLNKLLGESKIINYTKYTLETDIESTFVVAPPNIMEDTISAKCLVINDKYYLLNIEDDSKSVKNKPIVKAVTNFLIENDFIPEGTELKQRTYGNDRYVSFTQFFRDIHIYNIKDMIFMEYKEVRIFADPNKDCRDFVNLINEDSNKIISYENYMKFLASDHNKFKSVKNYDINIINNIIDNRNLLRHYFSNADPLLKLLFENGFTSRNDKNLLKLFITLASFSEYVIESRYGHYSPHITLYRTYISDANRVVEFSNQFSILDGSTITPAMNEIVERYEYESLEDIMLEVKVNMSNFTDTLNTMEYHPFIKDMEFS